MPLQLRLWIVSLLLSFAFAQVNTEFANERYEVQPGDYLSLISQKTGVSIDVLVSLNNLVDPDALEVGQILILPSNSSGKGSVANVAAIVPTAGIPRPVNQNVLLGMNELLSVYNFTPCKSTPYFFVSDDPFGLVSKYLDALETNDFIYEPLFQVGENPANTVTLARITGNGANVYSMTAVTDGASLMLCDAN